MISIETILNSSENDYMDFKREWYKPDEFKCDMVHDILCMANSLTDSPGTVQRLEHIKLIQTVLQLPMINTVRKQEVSKGILLAE